MSTQRKAQFFSFLFLRAMTLHNYRVSGTTQACFLYKNFMSADDAN